MTNSRPNRIAGPATGWSTTRSIACVVSCARRVLVVDRSRRSAAPRADNGGYRARPRLPASPRRRPPARPTASVSASSPRRRTATVGTTGTPSSVGERRIVDRQPVARRHVDHVERDDHRPAERLELEDEAQMIVEIGGVDDDDHRVGQPLALLRAEQHVARHLLVRARRLQAVGARADRPARPGGRPAATAGPNDARR